MEMSQGMLFYRLIMIVVCFTVFAFTYPSEIAKFALIAGVVGVFITLDKVMVKSNKSGRYIVMTLLFIIGFAITFYYTFL